MNVAAPEHRPEPQSLAMILVHALFSERATDGKFLFGVRMHCALHGSEAGHLGRYHERAPTAQAPKPTTRNQDPPLNAKVVRFLNGKYGDILAEFERLAAAEGV